ncbi:MAG: CoA ester lyase [Proteobacteria bacterium]|nr:CoA ester lyase [Pseudomonadota bacterium]
MQEIRPIERLRSLLFAPAVRPDFIRRLPERGADAVVIDCEDATPSGAKEEARANVHNVVPDILADDMQVFVRVNSVASSFFEADVSEGLVSGLAGIVVPKLETLAQADDVAAALAQAGRANLGVLAGIETALGVGDARTLLAHPQIIAAYFGAEDFIADMGGVRTVAGEEVIFARSSVALAARLAGIPVVDQIVADFRDDDRFRAESLAARAMGYHGKLCIHPRQVEIANSAFIPSREEVEHATRLLAAYHEASTSGIAAIDFEGQMVDEPLAAQARRILALAAPEDTL